MQIRTPSWSSDENKNQSIGSSMYSSSDSGFIREPLPEVDYEDSDDNTK
jgi:hypothetical protein